MVSLVCRVCGGEFESKTARRIYCSSSCKDRGKPSVQGVKCRVCGEPMVAGRLTARDGSAAHNACRSLHGTASRYRTGCRCVDCRAGHAEKQREYVAARAVAGRPLPSGDRWIKESARVAIYERDNGVCQICFDAVDFGAEYMDSLAPTLDHILPRALGGGDEPLNLRLAHRFCNCSRGARVEVVDGVIT